jgi:hypothetical protein
MRRSPQNIEPLELAGKIFQNMDLAAGFALPDAGVVLVVLEESACMVQF